MKSFFLIILGVLFHLHAFSQEISIMTYNIRLDVASDGENAWPNRKEKLVNQGKDKIKLANCYTDPSMVREALSYELANQYMDCPQASFIELYINTEYRGIYTNTESVDNEFLNQHYGSSGNSFFKCDPTSFEIFGDNSNLAYHTDIMVYDTLYDMKSETGLEELQALIDDNFTGKIKQTPPNRSAVKVQERERTVYHWTLTESGSDGRSFLFECRVEGGTYVRKLCSDLGEMVGGAHMGELRRTEAGIYDESSLVSLDDFEAAVNKYKDGDESDLRDMVMPAEDAIRKVLPAIEIDKSALKSLYIGRPLFMSNVTSGEGDFKEGDFAAAFCGEIFVGIYRRSSEEIIFGRPEFVFSKAPEDF